jgi:hypothetical protein
MDNKFVIVILAGMTMTMGFFLIAIGNNGSYSKYLLTQTDALDIESDNILATLRYS